MRKQTVRLTAGRTRTREPFSEKACRTLIALGAAFAVAAFLPLLGRDGLRREDDPRPPDAIAVMSGGVIADENDAGKETRERLAPPGEKKTSAEGEEWSVFDGIGELFAELIFGERE